MALLLRVLRCICELLPERLAMRLGAGLGLLVYHLGIRRSVVQGNMAWALRLADDPRRLQRLVRANYRHYGRSAMEFMRLRRLIRRGIQHRVRWIDPQHLLEVGPRGRLVLVAHLGNYPVNGAAAVALGARISFVVKRVRNQAVHDFWVEQLTGNGLQLIFNRDSMREILGVLRRGECLAFMYDQHDSRGGIWVDFMGRPACCFRAVPVLASRAEAVVPVFPHIERDGTHVLRCLAPIPFEDQGSEAANVAHYAQLYADLIADAVRAHPDQWLWLHKRWKPMPPDAPMTDRCRALVGVEG